MSKLDLDAIEKRVADHRKTNPNTTDSIRIGSIIIYDDAPALLARIRELEVAVEWARKMSTDTSHPTTMLAYKILSEVQQ